MAPIDDLDLLDPAEAAAELATVNRLRPLWQRRDDVLPFYTLGAPSYLDAVDAGQSVYYDHAARWNPILIDAFAPLYARLAKALSLRVGAPFEYEDRFSRPGFHIFLAHPAFLVPMATVHVDLQYLLVDWAPDDEPDFTSPLSFTASLCLPRAGAGLNVWDVDYRHGQPNDRASMQRRLSGLAPTYHAYRVGGLVLHSGHTVHQIAPLRRVDDESSEEARITLQGHAVRCRDVWKIYW